MARSVSSEKEEMLAGRLYDASDPVLVEERLHARELLYAFNHSAASARDTRHELLCKLFAELGVGSLIEPPFHCDYGYNITFGPGSYANVGCVFLDVVKIHIGRDVLFG